MKHYVLGAFLVLAACEASIASVTPRSIIMRNVSLYKIGDATVQAQAHCSKYDRDAEYVPDDRSDGYVTWKCVDR